MVLSTEQISFSYIGTFLHISMKQRKSLKISVRKLVYIPHEKNNNKLNYNLSKVRDIYGITSLCSPKGMTL